MSQNKMKIAVSSTGPTLNDMVDPRFGRCACFLIIDPDSLHFEPIENSNIALGGGAGIQSAQLIANKGLSVVLTGNCGPNAFQAFTAAGIQVITGLTGQVRQAVAQFKAGELSASLGASVQSHFGMGRGMGGGAGLRMGRGMGRGKGMGNGGIVGRTVNSTVSRREEIDRLRKLADEMRDQIGSIESKLRELEDK